MSDFNKTPIIELAAIVANHLQQHGIEVVLVGGLAVEIYSENLYLTKDIDMVDTSYQKPTTINQAMAELGFIKQGRIFVNETTEISVEFPSAPLSVGDELVKNTTTISTDVGEIPILYAEDIVKDRLAAYFHWQDKPSLVQAIAVMIRHEISAKRLQTFCNKEGPAGAYKKLANLYKTALQNKLMTMTEIESLVIEQTLENF